VSDDLSIPSPTYRAARRPRGMDPATQRLVLIAGGLGGVLLLVVGGWSMMGHRSTSVPVVQADSRPVRVKPENPGGMQIAGSNEDIFSGGNGTNDGKLAPPPEAPAPQALRAPPPPPAVVAAPAPVAAAVPAAPKPVAAAIPAPAKPVAVVIPAPAKPTVEKPVATPDKRAAVAAAPERNAPVAKGALVQFAAVSSQEAAKTEWQRLEKRMPDLLGHRQPAISKIDHDGHILWRVRTGGFSDVAHATAFCERVRAKGAGCSVADF
jgi:hypothetical protein